MTRLVDVEAPQPRVWIEVVAVLLISVAPVLWRELSDHIWNRPDDRVDTRSVDKIVWFFVMAIPVLFIMSKSGVRMARFGLVKPSLLDPAIGCFMLMMVVGTSGVLHRWVPRLVHVSTHVPPAASILIGGPVLRVISLVLGAFLEELVSRGYLITRITDASGSAVLALALSSIEFGACHLYQGVESAISAGFLGLVLGLGFLASRRLWPVFLAHLAWNLFVVRHY